jgi:hypothetical protein
LGGKHVHALIGKHSSEDDLGGFVKLGHTISTLVSPRKQQNDQFNLDDNLGFSTFCWGKNTFFFNSEDFAARLPAPEGLDLLDTAIQPLLLCILGGRWLYPVIRLESGKGSW